MSNFTTTTPTPVIEDCPVVHEWPDITLGSFLMIATLISYLPQYIKIIRTRSIEGLSHLMLVLANISAFTNFEGTILLDAHYYSCCKQNNLTKAECINTFLPVFHMGVPWLGSFVYYLIYTFISEKDDAISYPQEKRIRYSFLAYLILGPIVTGMIGTMILITTGELTEHPLLFGNILNITSAIICFVMWIPQITKTYREKDIGALSLVTLAIQGPGSILVFIYQDIINKNSWSVGVPFLFSGIQIITLLVMGYYYTYGIPKWCSRKKRQYASLNDPHYQSITLGSRQFQDPSKIDLGDQRCQNPVYDFN